MPENWGPLVTNKLQFGTEVALFSQDQWKEIGENCEYNMFHLSSMTCITRIINRDNSERREGSRQQATGKL